MSVKSALLIGLWTITHSLAAQAQDTLSLEDTIALALGAQDPSVQASLVRGKAEREAAIAAGSLPEPKASVSVRNLPVDDFDFNREAMTQIHLGVRQQFPRGKSRQLMRDGRLIMADEHDAMAETQKRAIVRDVSIAWHQVRYSNMASTELENLISLLQELRASQENDFAAAGKAALQKIYRTELEVALVQDRLLSVAQNRDISIEALARYIGYDFANRIISPTPLHHPALTSAEIDTSLDTHPLVVAASARNRQAANKVALAEEAYKPSWGLELGYGARYGDRSDFASAMVTFDLPIWTGKRQDPALRAAKHETQAAEFGRESLKRDLARKAHTFLADIRNIEKRIGEFETTVLPQAENVVTATRNAYGAGEIDFAELIRAEIAYVDSRLRLEMLRRDLGTAHAALAFITGDPS
ncbi:MAG: TolC family protein [Alphaproteobacteria bacterium]|nr:TolC family protein [Alphaproteobacteria bacterium]